ncbi:SCO family protein [Devosia sp.]|uniref:SCO family protein n=1 Tax=Devosia sp. TaxID=1871048 RepID=UPI003F708197
MKHTPITAPRLGSIFSALVATATLALMLLPQAAAAHSLKELENELSGRDKYFQPVNQVAPDFTLIDASGRTVNLADFRGKVVVLNFIYTNCGDVCPLHSQLIAQLQSLINISPMKDDVAFISVTTDPSNDQGAVLTAYGEAQGLDPSNWTFLTSPADQSEDTTRKVAKTYGLEFTEADGVQMHGLVTHVIDREGHLRGRFHGLGFEPVSLVTFANALVNDVHQSGESSEDDPDGPLSWISNLLGGSK